MLQVEDEDHKEVKYLAAKHCVTIPNMVKYLLNLSTDEILDILHEIKNDLQKVSSETHSVNVMEGLEQPLLSLDALIAEIERPTNRRATK